MANRGDSRYRYGARGCMDIVFHAIVPLRVWEWADGESHLHVRFDNALLGDMKQDCGEFQINRYLTEDTVELTSVVSIPLKAFLTHEVGIPFKYVVYSPRAENARYLWEYLYGAESTFSSYYRCLAVPRRMCAAGEKFHQYDTMIYPPPEFMLKQLFKGMVSGQESHEHPEIQCPPPELMRQTCLIYYLKVHEPLLNSESMPESAAVLISDVVHIYAQLAEHLLCVQSRVPGQPPSYEPWPVDNSKNAMSRWLSSVVGQLDGAIETREKKLFSAVVLSMILYKLTQLKHKSTSIKLGGRDQFNLDQVITLLEMLVLDPDIDRKECTEYDFLLGMLSEQRETASRAVTTLCNFAASKSGWNNPVWLRVSALGHFLSGATEPFSQLNPIKALPAVKAELQNPLSKEVRERRYPPETGTFGVHYGRLSALIEADPLLLLKVASVCPIEEAPTLFKKIPAYICVAWITEVLVKGGKISSQWAKAFVQKVELLTDELKLPSVPTTEKEFQDLHLASRASLQMLTELKARTEEKLTDIAVQCMKAALSLVLYTTQQLSASKSDDHFADYKPYTSIDKQDIFVSVQQILSEWISAVLGSGEIKAKKPKTEMELWHGILSVDCPLPLKEEWMVMNTSVLEARIINVTAELRVDLLVYIEKHCIETSKPAPEMITNVVIQATAEGLNMLCEREPKTAARCLEKLLRETGPSRQTGKLIGSILVKTPYTHVLTLKSLVEWPLWPPLLKAYKHPLIAAGMERESASLCRETASRLENVAKCIVEGSIKIEELENINADRDNKEQMNVLCGLVPFSSDVDSRQLLKASDVLKALEVHLEEYQYYKTLKVHLGELCNHMQDVDGASQLLADLQANYGGKQIRAVCQKTDSGGVRFSLFRGVSEVQTMLKPFYTMCNKHKSYTFLVIWDEQMKKAKASYPNLTIEDVPEKVWKPTLTCCQRFSEQLESREVKLAEVDKYFEGRKNLASRRLCTDLESFSAAIAACRNIQKSNARWIPGLVELLQQYWLLCKARDAAQALISLQMKLKFASSPRFQLVQRLPQEVDSGLRGRRLCDLPTELIETGQHLKNIAENLSRVECLKTLVNCWQVIEWIKSSSPQGLQDLNTFVDIASNTGEKSEMDGDKLQDLLTVGSGFQSLIYGFRSGDTYDRLVEQLLSVWEALKQTRNLSKLLEQCSGNLYWYTQVKEESEKSVEAAAYSQMCRIKKSGDYKIGSAKEDVCYDIHQVLSLEVRDGNGHERKYSLAELEELQSKLLLTTKSDTEKRKRVDAFSDDMQIVRSLGDKLMLLQRAGNTRYFGWSVRFSCGKVTQADMKKQLTRLSVELDVWNEQVKQARRKYYHLNNFTNKQLCAIRRVLCRAKFRTATPQSDIMPGILAMLQSISAEVSSKQIWHSTMQVISNPRGSGFAVISSSVCTTLRAPQKAASKECLPSDTNEINRILDQGQQKSFQHLTGECGFPKDLVHKAVQHCGTLDDAYRYCRENLNDFESEDEVSLGGISDSSDDACLEMKYDKPRVEKLCEIPLVSPHQGFSKNQQAMYDRLTKQYKFPDGIAHEAVQRHGDNEGSAYDYCRRRTDSQSEDEISVSGFSVQSVESSLKVNYHTTRERLAKQPGSLVLQSPSEPHHEANTSGGAQHTSLDPDHADGVFINEPAEEPYLSLEEVGVTLEHLRRFTEKEVQQRPFEKSFDTGSPNLIVTDPGKVLATVLAMYMADQSLPLPTFEEVLVCTASTTFEEVNLLWHRALGDPGYKRLFCLVHAERLSYRVSEDAFQSLMEVSDQQEGEYRLVIICSSEDDESPVVSKFHRYLKKFPFLFKNSEISGYLKEHFISHSTGQANHAAHVDLEKSMVRLVISNRAGMGKTLFITRLVEKLDRVRSKRLLFQTAPQQRRQAGDNLVTIPIHGPQISSDVIMNMLTKPTMQQSPKIIHLDVAPQVVHQVDTILFNMLILGGLCDSQGRVWRRNPSDMCAVELTVLEEHGRLKYPESALIGLLPSHECKSPVQVHRGITSSKKGNIRGMDDDNFESRPYQCVYQYLKKYQAGENLDYFSFQQQAIHGTPQECLSHMMQFCGIRNPSWRELSHFVQFLYLQLKSSEQSDFCNVNVSDLAGMKSFVIKFMIRMSRDFATSSLKGEVAQDEEEEEAMRIQEGLQIYHVVNRRLWEENVHPYIFFNEDGETITFVNVRVVLQKHGEKQIGCLQDPVNPKTRLEYDIMSGSLFNQLKHNKVNFEEDYKSWTREDILLKLTWFLGLTQVIDPDPSYALNVDNFVKILAIQTRFRCGIPVIIMGETGCGKTRLIRYMCDFAKQKASLQNMFIMKVHGGTSEQDIINMIEKLEQQIAENRKHKIDTVLFFDEANTTEAINLIKEVMCDRRIRGRHLPSDIKFIAACNPYKKHTNEMIKKLESAGLGFFVRTTDTQERIGKIPLRQLVYRVHDLPPSMRPLVYDFGQIPSRKEMDYTYRIVQNYNQRHLNSKLSKSLVSAISRVLTSCQTYMRNRKDECSFVSLRDIERSMIVFDYFYSKHELYFEGVLKKAEQAEKGQRLFLQQLQSTDRSTRSLVLSVSVCYLPRLQSVQSRMEFVQGITSVFQKPLSLPGGDHQFHSEVKWCQEVLLESMQLDMNTAKNVALRENVFMMAVCIELRIPLFLVGKPGSSKSLAKSIVAKSMLGQGSRTKLLRSFKQVRMVSYQCSQLSTSETIVEVFNRAMALQRNQNRSNFVAVVVLDEVGLAEDSPFLPLKALHPLLEDGTEGADSSHQILEREERVAFIGISNWALDPAKMNRGIMVTRTDPDVTELELSARSICSNEQNDPITRALQPYLKPIAEAYLDVCGQQSREFFGLRDFYSTIKMLYWMCKEAELTLTWHQIEHAVKRNFGGFEEFDPLETFRRKVIMPRTVDMSQHSKQLHSKLKPDSSPVALIKANLKPKDTEWNGEDRYLLFITENYAALRTLEHFLLGDLSMEKPLILFGSRFPKENEYAKVCRDISQIKICMETGRTVILLDLENLYESLYDLLNQYYTTYGENRYVDLGLQSHRVRCRVHKNFKLILIAEKMKVYQQFPIPLINRMEKHFVFTENVLTRAQIQISTEISDWISKFSKVAASNCTFNEQDAFIGYQMDTPATVVLQATHLIQSSHPTLTEESVEWKDEVKQKSKRLLLYTACPDALIRLQKAALRGYQKELCQIYFSEQHHSSLQDFLQHHASAQSAKNYFQITTHSRLLSNVEVNELGEALSMPTFSCLLQEFDTEQDFLQKISEALESRKRLLIVQCSAGRKYDHLIAYARYRVPLLQETVTPQRDPTSLVVFIIYIPRRHIDTSLVGLQGGHWLSAHIDDLREGSVATFSAMGKHISELLCSCESLTSGKYHYSMPLYQRLHSCIQTAASRLHESEEQPSARSTQRISILLDLIPKTETQSAGHGCVQGFYGALMMHVHQMVVDHEDTSDYLKEWVLNLALSSKELRSRGTFQRVLSQKMDDIITPKFAEILAFIDSNHNLDLVSHSNPAISRLWINFFSDPQICHFSYEELVAKSRQHIPAEEEFRCKFPFSSLIRQSVEEEWNKAKNIADADQLHRYSQLCELLSCIPIGKLLESVQKEGTQLAEMYMGDFIRSTQHLLQQPNDQLLKLMEEILSSKAAGFLVEESTLMHRIAAIHVAYHSCESQILWCVQLIYSLPEISETLTEKCGTSDGGLKLPLVAVEETLKCLQPPWDQDENGLCKWLGKVYQVQTAVESVLSGQQNGSYDENIRHQWYSIVVVRMFVEDIILKCGRQLVQYGRWLTMDVKGGADFSRAETLKVVHKLIQSIDKDLPRKFSIMDPKVLRTVRHCCHLFYMEVLSSLCFGQESLQPDLIQLLIDSIFKTGVSGGLGTRPLTPYNTKADDVPTVRSSLLQLLLAHNVDRQFLLSYFDKMQQVLLSTRGQGQVEEMNKIFLFFIMCYEDSKFKVNSTLTLSEQVSVATTCLKEGHLSLTEDTPQQRLNFDFIEGLAKARFALGIVAEVLCTHSPSSCVEITRWQDLLEVTKAIVGDVKINRADAGPAVYLLKLIVRRYGLSLMTILQKQHHWLVPASLTKCNKQPEVLNPFVVYPKYGSLHRIVSTAAYSPPAEGFKQFMEQVQDILPDDIAPLIGAIYEVITLSRMKNPTEQINPEILQEFAQLMNKSQLFIKARAGKVRSVAVSLIRNTYSGSLNEFRASAKQSHECQILSAVVVHTVSAFCMQHNALFLQPFTKMLSGSSALLNMYLPAMPEDLIPDILSVLTQRQHDPNGKFYVCPKGHPYFIGICGRPWVEAVCPYCKSKIGGQSHIPATGNAQYLTGCTTPVGYILGKPEYRIAEATAERKLSPASCALMQVLNHSCLLWASCNSGGDTTNLERLARIHSSELSQFFWKHLKVDMQALSAAVGRSLEETALLVHLILKEVSSKDPPKGQHEQTSSSLESKEKREDWEDTFNHAYIQPVLKEKDSKLKLTIEAAITGEAQECDQLLCVLYERMEVPPVDPVLHFWTYRTPFTLAHLMQTLQNKNSNRTFPILYEFLREEVSLRATQYISDIVKLQQFLHDKFNHRLYQSEAANKTIGDFQRTLREPQKSKFSSMLKGVSRAWTLVRDKLLFHARFPLEEKHIVAEITPDTPLVHLLPTTTGAGVCTTVLIDYLVQVHNSFVSRCRQMMSEMQERRIVWDPLRISVVHVHRCHLIDYERHILSVVFSHCHRTLRVGKGEDVKYDLEALEQHLVSRFIAGKPIINLEIPLVLYHSDVYTAERFAAIQKHVKPQIELSSEEKKSIVEKLHFESQNVHQVLDVVNTVLGFLASGGGQSAKPFVEYVDSVLKMECPFSQALKCCTLGHIISLWKVLSVELATQLILHGEEPFDTFKPEFMVELQFSSEKKQLEDGLGRWRARDRMEFLETLYEFIELHVRHCELHEKKHPLVDHLDAYLERHGRSLRIQQERKGFPATITLGKAIATWKYVAELDYKRKQEIHH